MAKIQYRMRIGGIEQFGSELAVADTQYWTKNVSTGTMTWVRYDELTTNHRRYIRVGYNNDNVYSFKENSSPNVVGQDSFAGTLDTDLVAHTPNTGGAWVKNPTQGLAGNKLLLDGNGFAYAAYTSTTSSYHMLTLPSTGAYKVQADIKLVTKVSDFPGVVARSSPVAITRYFARLNIGSSAVELFRTIANSSTAIGTFSKTFNAGETHTLALVMNDDGEPSVLLNGAVVIPSVKGENFIPYGGYGGLIMTGAAGDDSTHGSHIGNFSVTDMGSGINLRTPGVTTTPLPTTLCNTSEVNSVSFIQDNLWTEKETQYMVLNNASNKPVIYKRLVPNGPWSAGVDLSTVSSNPLATPTAADPHNTYAVGVSGDGHIHVCGNLHDSALQYIRTATAGDLSTFAAKSMVGTLEASMTYPVFVKAKDGTLLFFYRDGSSGQGDLILNKYSNATGNWTRVAKVIDGQTATESPYWQRIVVSPVDGAIHLFYCWRLSPTADTNNDICHMVSPDNGVTWKNMAGVTQTLPVTHASSPLVIDTAASGSGLLNSSGADVDSRGFPHAAYLMFDASGKMQIFHIWWDGKAWHTDQVTGFNYREDLTVSVVDADLARPAVACDRDGSTFIIYRSNANERGQIKIVDVSLGGKGFDAVLWDTDTYYFEPTFDTRALQDRNELYMIIAPSAPFDTTNNPDNSKTNFAAAVGYMVSISMKDVRTILGRLWPK